MDNAMIDSLLSGFLEKPLEDRTPDELHSTILFVAEAAGIQLSEATNPQLEHLKLLAAVRQLAIETGAVSWRVSMADQSDRSTYLYCCLTLTETADGTPDVRAYGIGNVADETLLDLRLMATALTADIKDAA